MFYIDTFCRFCYTLSEKSQQFTQYPEVFILTTLPIYEKDPYISTADAAVTSCNKNDTVYEITFDKTVFFPKGGGQPGDTGTAGCANVTDTYFSDDGEILHICDAPLTVGETVALKLDFNRRFDIMQQHTGEHILSYAFWRLFGMENVGFHMNGEFCTADITPIPSPEQINEALLFANRTVTENHAVKAYHADAKLIKASLKSIRKISEKATKDSSPRIVEIENADMCTCCGTHVRFTGEVGLITVIKTEKVRSSLRLYFLCGQRAVKHAVKSGEIIQKLTNELSTEQDNICDRVINLKNTLSETSRLLKEKTNELLKIEADRLLSERSDCYVLCIMHDADAAQGKAMLRLLTKDEPVTAIVLCVNKEVLNFLCGSNPASKGVGCKTIAELLCGMFSAKGGGREDFAQGSGKAPKDLEESAETVIGHLRKMK